MSSEEVKRAYLEWVSSNDLEGVNIRYDKRYKGAVLNAFARFVADHSDYSLDDMLSAYNHGRDFCLRIDMHRRI